MRAWARRCLAPPLLPRIAALAAAFSPFRPGTTTPAAGDLAAAPPGGAPEAVPTQRSLLRRSLRACTAEGLFAEIVSACAGGAVLTGWALRLRAGPLLTGIVGALPQMAQLFQIPAAWTTALLGHRRASVWLISVSRQVTLPLAALPFLPIDDGARRGVLLEVAALAAILGVLGNNAWVAWMAELVPRRIRGRYFGQRTGLCMLGGSLAAAGAGLLLDLARPRGLEGAALAGLQLAACAAGLVTTALLRRQHDPSPHPAAARPSIADALRPFRDLAVRPLLLHQLCWNGAVGVAGGLFSFHMLRNLRMTFVMVTLHGAALAAARMLAAPLWGRLVDRVGARPVLVTCSSGIAFVPPTWLFTSETRLWPVAIDAVLAGVLWSGHAIAAFALPLSAAPREGRPFYVAALATTGGVAFSAATAAAGALAAALPERITVAGHALFGLQLLFALSALLRLGAAAIAARVHEPRALSVATMFDVAAAMATRTRRPARPASKPAAERDRRTAW